MEPPARATTTIGAGAGAAAGAGVTITGAGSGAVGAGGIATNAAGAASAAGTAGATAAEAACTTASLARVMRCISAFGRCMLDAERLAHDAVPAVRQPALLATGLCSGAKLARHRKIGHGRQLVGAEKKHRRRSSRSGHASALAALRLAGA